MCMIEDSDGYVTRISVTTPRSRREHWCAECGRRIEVGERYERHVHIWDGDLSCHKTCEHCLVAREWLQGECGGWLFGGVEEDIRDHCDGFKRPFSLYRIAVGMAWQWRTKSGRLPPVPAVPPTTP